MATEEQPAAVVMGEPRLSEEIRANFAKHAIADEAGELHLGHEQFLDAVAPAGEEYHKVKREHYSILFQVADRSKTGKLRLSDWAAFEHLLAKPDADYSILFLLFDTEGSGFIDRDTFEKTYTQNKGVESIPFDFNSEWASLYIGGKKKRHGMTYEQFAQMMRGLQGERIRQAFHLFDKDKDGYIEPEDFQRIILETAKHKLSDHLLDNLPTLCNISQGSKISYANVRAFQNIIREMDLIDCIVRSAVRRSEDGKITQTDFLNEASRLARFTSYTPMEADILFHFAGLDSSSGRLGLSDFEKVIDASWSGDNEPDADEDSASKQVLRRVAESIYHFGLGSIAGAFGAFMVYPIDLVKTRLQNQRKPRVGEQLYKNSLDCAQKVFQREGLRGLYSGVLPQLIGVAPEKAIKLTVNDLVRGRFTNQETGAIDYRYEILAGGSAGACQVVFTNPLEIVKIRLQVQGEVLKKASPAAPKQNAIWYIRNLGFRGLYKGASACLLRDVPFSAIYFPTYAHLKKDLFGETPQKKLGILQLLTAGAIAGMPAAYLTTPCDVIKTRLQVEARKGEATYNGLIDCAKQIFRDEGLKAFFKGGPARIMRSSPQFGFTLAAYEALQRTLPMPGGKEAEAQKGLAGRLEPGVGLREAKAPLPYLRSRNAMKIILDLDENFGKIKVPAQVQGTVIGLPKGGK